MTITRCSGINCSTCLDQIFENSGFERNTVVPLSEEPEGTIGGCSCYLEFISSRSEVSPFPIHGNRIWRIMVFWLPRNLSYKGPPLLLGVLRQSLLSDWTLGILHMLVLSGVYENIAWMVLLNVLISIAYIHGIPMICLRHALQWVSFPYSCEPWKLVIKMALLHPKCAAAGPLSSRW